MIELLHTHGHIVGWRRPGGLMHVSLRLVRRAEQREGHGKGGCSAACHAQHEIEHLRYLVSRK